MSYTASLVDGTTVEIVDKVAEGQKTILLDADGNKYVRRPTADYITPVEVLEAVVEALKEEAEEVVETVKEGVADFVEAVKDEVSDAIDGEDEEPAAE